MQRPITEPPSNQISQPPWASVEIVTQDGNNAEKEPNYGLEVDALLERNQAVDIKSQREGLGNEGTSWRVGEREKDVEGISGESTDAKGADC